MMEQVFDFREFMLLLLRKCKLPLILAVAFGILGGAFGFVTGGGDLYRTTAGVNVNIVASARETAPLTDTMNSISSIVSDNFFYTGMIAAMQEDLTEERFSQLLDGKRSVRLSDLKDVISISVKGNLILVTVEARDSALSRDAAHAGLQYASARIPQINANVSMGEPDEQTVDVNALEGGGRASKALKFGLLGLGGGLVIGILWIFFFQVFDLRLHTPEDLGRREYPAAWEGDPAALSALAVALAARRKDGPLVVTVTASRPGTGIQPAAEALSGALSALRMDTVCVDLSDGTPGPIRGTDVPVLPESLRGPLTLSSAAALPAALGEHDAVVFTAPPIGQGDCAVLTAAVSGCVVLAEQKKRSRTDEIDRAARAIDSVGAHVCGVIVMDGRS